MAKYIHNKTESTKIYEGVECAADAFLLIPDAKLAQYANSDFVIEELAAGNAKMSGDGTTDLSGGASDQINFLKDYKPVDAAGRPVVRPAITIEGWGAQFHSVGFTVGLKDSVYNKDDAGNDLGFATMKFYDASGVEQTTQEDITANAVKTVLTWMPTHDYEIIGGQLNQDAKPASNVYMWAKGLPGILNVMFAQGGLNLKLCPAGNIVDFDGKASKFLPYNAGAGTNKFDFIFKHNTGVQHELQFLLKIFKA